MRVAAFPFVNNIPSSRMKISCSAPPPPLTVRMGWRKPLVVAAAAFSADETGRWPALDDTVVAQTPAPALAPALAPAPAPAPLRDRGAWRRLALALALGAVVGFALPLLAILMWRRS